MTIGPGGEIGKRVRLKLVWIHLLVGSTPSPGTIKTTIYWVVVLLEHLH